MLLNAITTASLITSAYDKMKNRISIAQKRFYTMNRLNVYTRDSENEKNVFDADGDRIRMKTTTLMKIHLSLVEFCHNLCQPETQTSMFIVHPHFN